MTTPLHDKTMAAGFLTVFDPDDEKFDFQLARGHERSRIFHGTLGEFWPAVAEANTPANGVEVFVLPNGFAGRQPRALFAVAKTKEQLARAQATITACDAKCDMIVKDVSQIVLCYLCSDIPVDQYATAQRRLSAALGTDSTIVDLSRIRLPGTLSFDNPDKPRLVGLLRNDASKDWKFDDLLGRLGSQDKLLEPNDHDKEMAKNYLSALDPTTDRFTFQTFDDNKERGDETLARVLQGTLNERFAELVYLSNRGAGIFVTIKRPTSTAAARKTSCECARCFMTSTALNRSNTPRRLSRNAMHHQA
jgi:hypothetical protein